MRQTKTDKPYEVPHWNYQGDELKPDTSIPPERMRAFTLPSREGNWLNYPDGRREPFPGTEPKSSAPQQMKCAVRGLVMAPLGRTPGAMCGHVITGGKLCGFSGSCEHQRHE